jgi:molecular chaperone GrpE
LGNRVSNSNETHPNLPILECNEEITMTKKKEEIEVPGEEQAESAVEEEEEKEQPQEERDELEGLRSKWEKAQAQADEYLDGWQRAQAEFSNYKKRQEVERAQMRARVAADVLRKILPVVDDFERALATMPDDLSQLTWCEGVVLIKAKLDAILDSEGIKPIETDGQTFDPIYHEAVTYEEAAGYKEGQIIGEVQRGYMLDDRVLRPALVRVAKAPPSAKEDDNSVENKEE